MNPTPATQEIPAIRRTTQLILFIAVALTAAVLPAAPAAADAASGGHINGDAQHTGAFDATGPSSAAVQWVNHLEGYRRPHNLGLGPAVLDSAGHLVVHAVDADDPDSGRNGVLIALDRSDGSIVWVAEDIGHHCRAVASDSGHIYATEYPVTDQSRFDLVELDAATGERTGRRIQPSAAIGTCGRLLLTPDDTVIVKGAAVLSAVDTTTPDLTVLWQEEPGLPQIFTHEVALSPDASTVYAGTQNLDDGTLALWAFDMAGGAPENLVVPDAALPLNLWVLGTDTGVIASTGSHVFEVADDGAGLTMTWQTTDTDVPSYGLALTDGMLVGTRGEDDLLVTAADPTTGEVIWTAPDQGYGRVVADSAGNTYVGDHDGVRSLAPDGTQRWLLPPDAVIDPTGNEFWDLGPIGTDGTLYVSMDPGSGGELHVVAIGDGGGQGPGGGDAMIRRIRSLDQPGDVRSIAINLCSTVVPTDGVATRVLLSRDDAFADALAGAALSDGDSCLLFTGSDGELDPRTRAEIDRALADGGEIAILGGVSAVPQAVEAELAAAGYAVERFAGATRYETAAAVAAAVRDARPDGAAEVALAYGGNWADAVTVGAYAAARGVPVVLTPTETLHPAAAAFLSEDAPDRTIVVGGIGVVSDQAAQAAPNPVRVAGQNRMGTAAAIASTLWPDVTGTTGDAVFANLEHPQGWTVALAAASLSAETVAPQLGVRADSLPLETGTYLRERPDAATPTGWLLGDETFITTDAEAAVAAALG